MQWDTEYIRDLIAKASAYGEATAKLHSRRDAILFRWAVRNQMNLHKIGQGLTTHVKNSEVKIEKKPEVKQ